MYMLELKRTLDAKVDIEVDQWVMSVLYRGILLFLLFYFLLHSVCAP